jgi:ubiquinone/menaquinone biosynthesis C-methylase UbiE
MVGGETTGINAHYGRQGLGQIILEALKAAGKDPDHPTIDDLAPVDHLHVRGKGATLELARRAGLRGGEQVLDVGGGLGGPARTLADAFSCQVTVLDLTEEYCRVGEMLTARTGLSDRVTFRHGSALEIPFDDGTFDVVWTQHSTMNIADKDRLYSEIHRVLRPGGQLAMHEILAGPVQPILFPVPWAADASISFLRSAEDIRALLQRIGLMEIVWEDESQSSLTMFRERAAAAAAAGPTPLPPLGTHVSLGPGSVAASANVGRNLAEDRLAIVQAIYKRA